MAACSRCSGPIEAPFRYCPWCAAPQRLKLVEFFRAHPLVEEDRTKSLRVSRYLSGVPEERHVRFSVWDEVGGKARADAAVSLDEREVTRLARFVLGAETPSPGVRHRLRSLVPRM